MSNQSLSDAIELKAYDPAWPRLAHEEMEHLKCRLGALAIGFEHIGSTAVPGLHAKPIVDIMVGANDFADARSCVPILESIGYSYWRENPHENHFFFVKGHPKAGFKGRTHHVHVIQRESDFWKMQILFRDYLRDHPAAASEYVRIKSELSVRFRYDRDAYTEGKTEFVHSILRKTGWRF